MTSRFVLAGGCLALAMLTAAACQQINNALDNRDLECTAVPDDICARLADYMVGEWLATAPTEGPLVKVSVRPIDCDVLGPKNPPRVRCWGVEAQTARSTGLSGYHFFLLRDGTLIGPNEVVVGN